MQSNNSWVVAKFGGTSVARAQTYDTIVQHFLKLIENNKNLCIVVSAVSQVTNLLEKCLDEIESFEEHYEEIRQRHSNLIQEIGYNNLLDEDIEILLKLLYRVLCGIQMTGDVASSRLRAKVLGFGELLSSTLAQKILNKKLEEKDSSIRCAKVDARDFLFSKVKDGQTNLSDEEKFLNAYVPAIQSRSTVESSLPSHCRLFITQGFIASQGSAHTSSSKTSPQVPTVVLGRGGGDTSGALFASLLEAERLEIWTDVHGMFTADPRDVQTARIITELSYREAQELAAMGAKVLHPRCLVPIAEAKIPVEIHNTLDPWSTTFTRILPPEQLQDKETTVMAISKRQNQVLININTLNMWGASGYMYKIFEPFYKYGFSVDLVATSQQSVSLTLEYIPEGLDGPLFQQLISDLKKFSTVEVHKSCTVFSIVGRRLRTVLQHLTNSFALLAKYNILLLSESSEDLNLSFVVEIEKEEQIKQLIRNLHRNLLEGKTKLPKPEARRSLFGKGYNQLTSAAGVSNSILRKKSRLFSIDELPLEAFNLLNSRREPAETQVMIKVEALSQPFEYFPLSISGEGYFIKLLLKLNPGIKFIVSDIKQVHPLLTASEELDFDLQSKAVVLENVQCELPTLSQETLNKKWMEKKIFHKFTVVCFVKEVDVSLGRVLLNFEAPSGSATLRLETSLKVNAFEEDSDEENEACLEYDVYGRNSQDPFGASVLLFECVCGPNLVKDQKVKLTGLNPFSCAQSSEDPRRIHLF
eukprot:snap_masked-scaffold_14-processed-gene-7.56-mRNA-1 protein AED:0.16 eAED:0.16 QI:0/-1/0/1/-1/1/1/0/754